MHSLKINIFDADICFGLERFLQDNLYLDYYYDIKICLMNKNVLYTLSVLFTLPCELYFQNCKLKGLSPHVYIECGLHSVSPEMLNKDVSLKKHNYAGKYEGFLPHIQN